MIFITGGFGAGKTNYLREELGYSDNEISSGVITAAPAVTGLQKIVAENPENIGEIFDKLREKEVVVCDEIGCGVIPAEPRERFIREQTGKLSVRLASHADTVIRVVCGIGIVLKGAI